MRTLVPEAGISGKDKQLHATEYCRMQLLIPSWDTCFWHHNPHIILNILKRSHYQNVNDSKGIVISCNLCDISHKWNRIQDLYSLSGKECYRQIPRSLEAARLNVMIIVSLCCRGACQISERLIKSKPESRGFTRSCGKTPVRLVNRGRQELNLLSGNYLDALGRVTEGTKRSRYRTMGSMYSA